jgi:uncharacterized protein (DUF2252 family)
METHVQQAFAAFTRLTGKNYPELRKALETLTGQAAIDLVRLALDLDFAKRSSERRAALQPWRHW